MTTGAYHPRSRSGARDMPHGLNRHRGLRMHQIGRRYRRLRHGDSGPCEREGCLCCEDRYEGDWDDYERYDAPPDPEVLLSVWREGVAFTAARARIAHCMPTALAIGHCMPTALASGQRPPTAPRERPERAAARGDAGELGPRFTTAELPAALHEHSDFLRSQLTHLEFIHSERCQRALRELADGLGGNAQVFTIFSAHAGALGTLLLFSRFWVRPLWTFTPPAGDAAALVTALVTHLLARYPVPPPLLRAFTTGAMPAIKWVCWTILFGQGGSLRAAARLFGWCLPRGVIAALQQAPADLDPVAACQWAEIAHRGGTRVDLERLRDNPAFAIDPSDPALPFDPERWGRATERFLPFWHQTVSFLVRHRAELTDESSRLLLAWAMHRFTEDDSFSWAGRTPASASAAARAYDEQRRRPYVEARWAARGWDWESSPGDPVGWSLVELTSGRELYEEGQAMRHCVAGYAWSCCTGDIAIFSLRSAGQRRVTVELATAPRDLRVRQARGACNRAPTPEEEEILRRWLLTLRR